MLLIFLVSALTMRSWSEERRSGTLESLLTSPVGSFRLVMGKFLASLALVALALLFTLPLAVTVSLLGPLDWGPVVGGYVASLFLSASYVAIGLYMSGRTDNPIVALILTVAVAGCFYLLGSSTVTTLFGHEIGRYLELLGSGSRFYSITRGVFDVRDIYYYCSIVGVFLALNVLTLERIRWAGNSPQPRHRQWNLLTGLAILNFILVNIWLSTVGDVRVDLTNGKIYSLSPATKQYLQQLEEPLLIRGYFSEKSHPLLEPLVPQLKDLLEEYQVAGGDKVRVEFVDPHTDQNLEEEAAEKYGIRPVPFRMASKYQAGVVNSYFNLVVAYGDQYESLSFQDLVEVKGDGAGEPEVLLKNPEYAITRSLRKVTNAYQAGGDLFANLQQKLTFYGYISPNDKLPEALGTLSGELKEIMTELQQSAGDKLKVEYVDPDSNSGAVAQKLKKEYGFGPQIASLFDPKPFWFYMVLQGEGEAIQVPLPADLDRAGLKNSIKATIKRMSPGYLKTVAIVEPPAPPMNPYMAQMGGMQGQGKSYTELRKMLSENVRLKDTDLKNGQVPADADLLLLLAPESLDDTQLFAVDQFLMQGGSVVVTSSPFDVEISNSLLAKKHHSGLEKWLGAYGISMTENMVLDPRNASLPVPVRRNLGPITVNEIKMMPYPHFPDIREKGLDADNPMTSSLGQLTLNWASPVVIDNEKNSTRKVVQLLHSSPQSWTADTLNVLPDYSRYPDYGFQLGEGVQSHLLAVTVTGSFDSWFAGKNNPILAKEEKNSSSASMDSGKEGVTKDKEQKTLVGSTIEHSSDSARIVLVSSNTFACDSVINLASQGQGRFYTAPLEFIQNAIDWSLDDQGLMSIRSRAQFSRTLNPMEQSTRIFWEYLNYIVAFLELLLIWLWRRMLLKRKQSHYQHVLAEV